MRLNIWKKMTVLLACLVLMMLASDRVSNAMLPPPNPVLLFVGQEDYEANGKQWTRYKYIVFNLQDFPNDLFAPAPDLPPCGQNAKSARTWIDIYDQRGKRLYGFCALGSHDGLGQLWFALERNVIPPSWVYIEMNDRKTNTRYKSNLAETTG
jgi:hypothetical protein